MIVRINKKVGTRRDIQYSEMLSGTISHVWLDEETDDAAKSKRVNHVRLTRDANPKANDRFDA